MPDFDPTEQELHTLLGEPGANPTTHPSPQLLRAFGQDVLPAEVEQRIAQHLQQCRVCTMLRADLETLPEPELSAQQNQHIAARILPAKSPSRLLPWLGAIAALLLIAAGISYVARTHRPTQGVTIAHDAPKPQAPVTVAALEIPVRPLAPPADASTSLQTRGLGGRNPSVEELMPAFVAYRKGDYATASTRFEHLARNYPSSDLVSLYLGVTQLLTHQDDAANATLQRTRKLNPHSDAAQWYSALAALHTHSPEAKSLFETLCSETNSPYSTDSCQAASSLR